MAPRFSTLLGTSILVGLAGCGTERASRDAPESRLHAVKDIISLQRTGNPGEYSALCSNGTRETLTEWDLRNDNACPHVPVPRLSGIVSMQRREDGRFDVVCDTDVTQVRVVTAADIVAGSACKPTPRLRILGLSAGRHHTCALTSGGSVKCWGNNERRQLGDGSEQNRLNPVEVKGLSGVTALAGGYNHNCTLLSAGSVKCWGYNYFGQLGNGGSNGQIHFEPVEVKGLSGVTAIAGGDQHSCALLSTGKVKCWGFNYYGQLGDGSHGQLPSEPVAVKGLSGVTAIAAGAMHTCALMNTGNVKCWGRNEDGQLGDGSIGNRYELVDVKGLSGVMALAAGGEYTCALLSTGSVKCWGHNGYGQLGDGSRADRQVPVEVKGLSGVIALVGGYVHTCAAMSAGSVKCWGENELGQLGDGSRHNSNVPVDVKELSGVTTLTGGRHHTCALTSGGSVKCWGSNEYGQLGNGTMNDSNTPVDVSGITD
jgi:alpha-tubulin suppressor-like RCC1 family protein